MSVTCQTYTPMATVRVFRESTQEFFSVGNELKLRKVLVDRESASALMENYGNKVLITLDVESAGDSLIQHIYTVVSLAWDEETGLADITVRFD